MRSPFDFIIEPKGLRYNNSVSVGDKKLILNTEISNHEYINRQGVIKSIPTAFKTVLEKGDDVIVHHNVFRRWYDMKAREKNSRSFLDENTYLVKEDQIFLYKRFWQWKSMPGYTWVRPVKETDEFSIEKEKPLVGIVEYSNVYNKKDIVGFSPNDEFEFVIEDKRLYRVMDKYITIKYERERNEEAYNTSWAQGS